MRQIQKVAITPRIDRRGGSSASIPLSVRCCASISGSTNKLFLHVGPSGDSWIGDAIFAAKHNQPGYVKSIPLIDDSYNYFKEHDLRFENADDDEEDMKSILIEVLEEHPELAQEIYNTESLPETLVDHLDRRIENDR